MIFMINWCILDDILGLYSFKLNNSENLYRKVGSILSYTYVDAGTV